METKQSNSDVTPPSFSLPLSPYPPSYYPTTTTSQPLPYYPSSESQPIHSPYYPSTTTTTTTTSSSLPTQPFYAVPPSETLPISPLTLSTTIPSLAPVPAYINYLSSAPLSSPLPLSFPPSYPLSPQPSLPLSHSPSLSLSLSPIDEKHKIRLQNFIFLGSNGVIRALELVDEGGEENSEMKKVKSNAVRVVWNDQLKGAGYYMVHIHLDAERGLLYAVTNGHVYSFDALTGRINWVTKPELQNGMFASDIVSLLLTKDGSMLISASNGAIIAINTATGDMLKNGTETAFTLLEYKGILIVGNHGCVCVHLLKTGQMMWKNNLEGYGYYSVSLAVYPFNDPVTRNVYDILLIGTCGYVLALDILTGTKRHEVNLEGTGYKPVALLIDSPSDSLFAATSGELRCYSGASLTKVWLSELPGMGYAHGHSLFFSEPHIIIGINGNVAALEKTTGTIVWHTELPRGGHMVTVGTMSNPNILVVASTGILYGLNRTDGRVLWEDGLEGMGYHEISLSTTAFNTDFNSTTLTHNLELQKQQ